MNQQVLKLQNIKQYAQLTPEWYSARQYIITASSAAVLLNKSKEVCSSYVKSFCLEKIFEYNDNKSCNPYSNKLSYIKEKSGICPTSFTGNFATLWGQKYEEIASNIYSIMTNSEILEFGLIVHPELNWLGASPDGITTTGTMLEIKCPPRRKISGIPPLYYWIQVQLQLEVCDLESCDFFECDFREYLSLEEFMDDTLDDCVIYYKGIIIKKENENNKYIYPNKNTINDINKINKTIEKYSDKDKYSIIFWKLINYSNVKIYRDKEWFNTVKPLLYSEWDLINKIKANNELINDIVPECIFD